MRDCKHLGLVAGICQELGIADAIDQLIPNKSPDKIVSTGTGAVAMILNGLGFVNKRIYLVPRFFEGKPVDKLLNVSYLEASHLNNDALSRCLDALDGYGTNQLYSLLSQRAVSYLQSNCDLELNSFDMDNTTFSLHGKEKSLTESDETTLEITWGHSKDHRPDLVQVGLQLIVESQSGIPLLMEVLSGNAEESKSYGKAINTHISNLQDNYGNLPLVGDSKLYTSDNLEYLSEHKHLHWITRVPGTLLKGFFNHLHEPSFTTLSNDPNYSFLELGSNYGGVSQKWVVFLSQNLRETQQKQLIKKYKKGLLKEEKLLAKLKRQKFHCPSDAEQALAELSKSFKYSLIKDVEVTPKHLYSKKGKPGKNEQPKETYYQIKAENQKNEIAYQAQWQATGYFILASNNLSISADNILTTYKNQAVAEKSFRFLKDPRIVASSLFVQKPERIRALLFIMTLCLLVYATLEYKIRHQLKKKEQTFDNQLGKPIEKPTLHWIFSCFEGIEILYEQGSERLKKKGVLNLKPRHRQILELLGEKYWRFYT